MTVDLLQLYRIDFFKTGRGYAALSHFEKNRFGFASPASIVICLRAGSKFGY